MRRSAISRRTKRSEVPSLSATSEIDSSGDMTRLSSFQSGSRPRAGGCAAVVAGGGGGGDGELAFELSAPARAGVAPGGEDFGGLVGFGAAPGVQGELVGPVGPAGVFGAGAAQGGHGGGVAAGSGGPVAAEAE